MKYQQGNEAMFTLCYNSVTTATTIPNQSNYKMSRSTEQTFSERRHPSKHVHGKALSVTNHQGNRNQNHDVLSPHTSKNTNDQEDK